MDNNSTDNTRTLIAEFARSSGLAVKYVFEPQQGLSYARNAGVANSNGEILAFTDDDVLVAPEWLAELLTTFEQFPCIGVGGRSIAFWNGILKPDWFTTEGPYRLSTGVIPALYLGDEAKRIEQAPFGLNMAFQKSAFERYGLFRTDLGRLGTKGGQGEDTEFGRRLMRAGEKIFYSPKAVVFHPVLPNRITKTFCLSYYLNTGRAQIREMGWPSAAVLWFGVPRYLFRMLSVKGATWLTARKSAKRFYYKTQFYLCLGQLAEAWAVRRKTPAKITGQVHK